MTATSAIPTAAAVAVAIDPRMVAFEYRPHVWRPASNGAGKLRWFVFRHPNGCERIARDEGSQRYAEDGRGNIRRFGSREAAQRAADRMNIAEGRL